MVIIYRKKERKVTWFIVCYLITQFGLAAVVRQATATGGGDLKKIIQLIMMAI